MADRLRFHLDEHVDPVIAKALRSHGVDVSTTVETGLLGASDEDQLRRAEEEGRVLVSHDADFLRLGRNRSEHAGIAYCHLTLRTPGELIRTLILMYEVLEPEEMRGRVEYL